MNNSAKQSILDRFPNSRFGMFDEWKNTHDWIEVEFNGNYTVWSDKGYGLLALTKGNELIDVGKLSIVTPELVVLDKDYYGTAKYIWR